MFELKTGRKFIFFTRLARKLGRLTRLRILFRLRFISESAYQQEHP